MSQPSVFPGGGVRGVKAFRAALPLALLLVGAAGAQAQQIRTLPGSSCQASGSAQDLYYSSVSIANRSAGTRSAVCPIEREKPLAALSWIAVVLNDRHSTQNVTCVAEARDVTGTAGTGWSETHSSVGEGVQVLAFGPPPAGAVPDYGPYVLVCSIPAMEEVNQPSFISSILIAEP
jgi:hypothetical protein